MHKTRYTASIAVTAAIIVLSFIKTGGGGEYDLFPHVDKAIHAIMYFTLSTALCYDLREKMRPDRYLPCMLTAIGAAMATGILTELGQEYLTTYRSGDIYDFLADTAGSIAGAATTTYILATRTKKRK